MYRSEGSRDSLDFLNYAESSLDKISKTIAKNNFVSELDKRIRKRLSIISDICQSSYVTSLDEIINYILEIALEVTDSDRSFLVVLNEDFGNFRLENAYCKNSGDVELGSDSLNVSKTVTGMTVSTKKPVYVVDISKDEVLKKKTSILELSLKAVICLPLFSEQEIIGMIYLDSQNVIKSLSPVNMNLLEELSNLASLVIQNRFILKTMDKNIDAIKSFGRNLKIKLGRRKTDLDYSFPILKNNEFIIGADEKMQKIFKFIEAVSKTDASVLIEGESGTGKELVADAIHYRSRRKNKTMVTVNCAALPETLLESELFGHVRWAFTDAKCSRDGRFKLADGGTLFLDEIGDISKKIQVKLLRVLQEGEFECVGGTKTEKVNVRLITATNKNLVKEIEDESFREDLFYRINVVTISIPPLRDRKRDIPLLASHFLELYSRRFEKNFKEISPEVMKILRNYYWPGNVRELENIIERAVTLGKGPIVTVEDLPDYLIDGRSGTSDSRNFDLTTIERFPSFSELEMKYLRKVLEFTNWNRGEACKILEISRPTLRKRIRKYNLLSE